MLLFAYSTPLVYSYSNAQCCATDVLGVADLDCADPPTVPSNATAFQADCATMGLSARCCVLPIVCTCHLYSRSLVPACLPARVSWPR